MPVPWLKLFDGAVSKPRGSWSNHGVRERSFLFTTVPVPAGLSHSRETKRDPESGGPDRDSARDGSAADTGTTQMAPSSSGSGPILLRRSRGLHRETAESQASGKGESHTCSRMQVLDNRTKNLTGLTGDLPV